MYIDKWPTELKNRLLKDQELKMIIWMFNCLMKIMKRFSSRKRQLNIKVLICNRKFLVQTGMGQLKYKMMVQLILAVI